MTLLATRSFSADHMIWCYPRLRCARQRDRNARARGDFETALKALALLDVIRAVATLLLHFEGLSALSESSQNRF